MTLATTAGFEDNSKEFCGNTPSNCSEYKAH